ncbi:MAG: hypothetical protein ACLFSI_08310 [Halorhodospira sp.]
MVTHRPARTPGQMMTCVDLLRLRREFAIWAQRVLLRRKPFAEQNSPDDQEVRELEEVQEVLAERIGDVFGEG